MKTKLNIDQNNYSHYMKLWGIDENKSHTDAHRFTNRLDNESKYPPKKRKLKDWNWKKNFKSLEDATEFLLNYANELGPLADECLQRLNKNAETIRHLTTTNKNLRRSLITNDYNNKDRQE